MRVIRGLTQSYTNENMNKIEEGGSRSLIKNLDSLSESGQAFVPVKTIHGVVEISLTPDFISRFREYCNQVQEDTPQFNGSLEHPEGSSQWLGWNLLSTDPSIVDDLEGIVRENFRQFLSSSIEKEEEHERILKLFDFFGNEIPSRANL